MVYHYSTIRFVPDPARGEFVNLGLLAGDDDAEDWDMRTISNFRRAKQLDTSNLLPAALGFLGELEGYIESIEQLLPLESGSSMSLSMLNNLAGEMNNVVQLSPPAPIVAEDAMSALDLLFDELVVEPESRRFRFEKKHRAVRSVQQTYRDHQVPSDAVTRRAPVKSGPYEQTFDFAVSNGSVLQLVQCWSFQLPNQAELSEQVKAWAWMVHELGRQGGELVGEGETLNVPAGGDLEVAAVFISPEDGQDPAAFDEAKEAFSETGVLAVPPEEVASIGESAAKRLALAS